MTQNPKTESNRLQLARDALAAGRVGDAETAVLSPPPEGKPFS
jgi:hypothetical protein